MKRLMQKVRTKRRLTEEQLISWKGSAIKENGYRSCRIMALIMGI